LDTELLATFLEVNRTRHFGRAAENLFLTQSAVSARIRLLEETLGVELFTRARNDIQLTPAGTRLLKHAEAIINAWNRARQESALGSAEAELLAIGGVWSLWDIWLQDWLHRLRRERPHIALQAEAYGGDVLIRRLLDGALDIGFMFEPPQIAELLVRELPPIRLVLVADRPGLTAREATGAGYVRTDWGTSFATAHARHFPDIPPPAVRVGLGRMALALLLECGGAAYLAEQMITDHLLAGRLHRVDDAPAIDRQVYAAYPLAAERRAVFEDALSLLTAEPAPHTATTPVA
jgi:DNA-binding transcriptional LysR family regulator